MVDNNPIPNFVCVVGHRARFDYSGTSRVCRHRREKYHTCDYCKTEDPDWTMGPPYAPLNTLVAAIYMPRWIMPFADATPKQFAALFLGCLRRLPIRLHRLLYPIAPSLPGSFKVAVVATTSALPYPPVALPPDVKLTDILPETVYRLLQEYPSDRPVLQNRPRRFTVLVLSVTSEALQSVSGGLVPD